MPGAEADGEPWKKAILDDEFLDNVDVLVELFFANLRVKQSVNVKSTVSSLNTSFTTFMWHKTGLLDLDLEPPAIYPRRSLLEEAAREWAQLTLASEEAIKLQMHTEWLERVRDGDCMLLRRLNQ